LLVFQKQSCLLPWKIASSLYKARNIKKQSRKIFLHRGIATRQFQRSFVLADGIEVGEAFMDIGLLHIDLVQNIPANIIQKIEIKTHR
jgi:HSP20 family molecular chaperone IbpA